MQDFGKIICFIGLLLAGAGFLIWKVGNKLPLGKLPGDISIQKPGFAFYFPVTTCLLISLILSLLLWLLRK